jgi:hypothetical protein
VSASTFSARLFTVFYAALGIPLFFAFVKEEGNQCRIWFTRAYNYIKRCQRDKFSKCCWNSKLLVCPDFNILICLEEGRFGKRYSSKDESEQMRPALLEAANFRTPFFHSQSSGATHGKKMSNFMS